MLAAIISNILTQKYELYTRPFELNIVGVRADSILPNRFDDLLNVFFKNNQHNWVHYRFAATTDPGTYWLQNPMHPQGTAILAQGQYKAAYQIGLHKGQYSALVQVKPVTVMRDYDRNALLDFMNGRPDTGMFGINIHRASVIGTTKTVDRNSAGCQVFANVNDFQLFMQLCEVHRQQYGNSFSYTLIDQRAIRRERQRKLAFAATGAGIAAGVSVLTYYSLKS